VANSGNFVETTPLLWAGGGSPFGQFMELSNRLFQRFGQAHGIALHDLAEFLFNYLTTLRELDPQPVAAAMWRDYQRGGRVDCPPFLREYVPEPERRVLRARSFATTAAAAALPRQARHTHR
jgi:hypothetical protein